MLLHSQGTFLGLQRNLPLWQHRKACPTESGAGQGSRVAPGLVGAAGWGTMPGEAELPAGLGHLELGRCQGPPKLLQESVWAHPTHGCACGAATHADSPPTGELTRRQPTLESCRQGACFFQTRTDVLASPGAPQCPQAGWKCPHWLGFLVFVVLPVWLQTCLGVVAPVYPPACSRLGCLSLW